VVVAGKGGEGMFLNNQHINQKAPPNMFGGAMCMCKDCQDKYWSKEKQLDMVKIMQEAQEATNDR